MYLLEQKELIRGMVEVNHRKRLTVTSNGYCSTHSFPLSLQLDQVMQHPWFRSSTIEGSLEPVLPMRDMVSTCALTSRRDIDMDVFKSMTSLGCFKDKQGLLAALISPELVHYLITASYNHHLFQS